jgi:hypothetical protein
MPRLGRAFRWPFLVWTGALCIVTYRQRVEIIEIFPICGNVVS